MVEKLVTVPVDNYTKVRHDTWTWFNERDEEFFEIEVWAGSLLGSRIEIPLMRPRDHRQVDVW